MIDKKALLEKMGLAMKSEEGLIRLYTTHLQNVVGYGALDRRVKTELSEMLERLRKESQVHYESVCGIVNSIENSDRDAY